jgi:hypothetical protein
MENVVYNTEHMKILSQKVEDILDSENKQALQEILANYNTLICNERELRRYIRRKKTEWLEQMNENFELKEKNNNYINENLKLKKTISLLRDSLVQKQKEISCLNKEINNT